MADMVRSVPSKVAEYLVAPVGCRCGYVTFYDSYVRQLKHELEKLDEARSRVQRSVDEARSNMKPIKAVVERWATNVETVASKAREMLEDDGRAKKTCFYGWLPNPKARYRLGKEVSRTVKDIQALIARGQFEKVDFENPSPGLVGGAPDVYSLAGDGGDTIFDSRASIFQDIMKALDDEKLPVIGVYGPGGVGKTTLLEEVERKLRKMGRPFHIIVKAEVSPILNLEKIQDDIAYGLGLNLKDEPSKVGRGDLLFRRIQSDPSEKVLIILDDLWDGFDLKAVGIPRGCKLLLTSRFRDVLEQKMLSDRTFRLTGLSNDEAFRLFEKMVGDRLKSDEELKAIAAQVVKKLAGLPFLIISVAGTLKDSDVSAWRNALIEIDEPYTETTLKLSYDHLKSEDTKSLFLLCGLIGGTIQVETLLELGLGLGLFQRSNKTMQDARDLLNFMLDSLDSICLLQDSGDDKENVTIHDLYGKVIVSTPFRGQNSLMMNNKCGPWPKEKLQKCWAICLVNVGNDMLAEWCELPELKILMLSQSKDWLGSPAHRYDVKDCCRLDFTCMKGLRVLYLRSMHITTLPSSIEILKNLRSLILDSCLVEDVAILGKLKTLQILSFAWSAICRLPKEIGELTNLRLLNLSNCNMLKIIEPDALKNLVNLEELHMKGSFDRWIGKDEIPLEVCNASLAELKSLIKLTTLEISIPDPTVVLKDDDQLFGNLIRFWINIGNLDGRDFGVSRTMKLKLKGCDSILSKEWVQKTLQITQYLHLDGLREFKKNTQELCIQGLPQLKHLNVNNSPAIEYIVDSSNGLPLTTFTILESLFLENLINLEKICNGPVSLECFRKLKVVHIQKCHRLKNIWFFSEVQRLVFLEEIQVCKCDSMQAIIIDDARLVVADDTIELPNVHRLDLCELPNMTSFCSRANSAPIQVAFPRLETLEITGLDDLRYMFLPSMVKSLAQLRELRVSDCINMEAIIMEEEGWGMEALETLAFPMLTELHLQRLERVTCFSCTKCSQEAQSQDGLNSRSTTLFNQKVAFPNLETLEISAMSNINMIWENQVYFRHLKTLNVSSCDGLSHIFTPTIAENLAELKNLTIASCKILTQVMFDGGGEEGHVVAFKQLKYLKLHMLAGLKCFSSGRYTLVFPLLEDVMLVGCLDVKFFSEQPIEAPKLDEVTKCEMWFWKDHLNVISQNLLAMVAEEKKNAAV